MLLTQSRFFQLELRISICTRRSAGSVCAHRHKAPLQHSPARGCTPCTCTLAPAISQGNQVPMRVPGVPLTAHYSHVCS